MATQWFYSKSKDGESQGPVTGKELKRLAETGVLLPTDYVFREGIEDRVEASRVKGLFTALSATAEIGSPAEPAPLGGVTPDDGIPGVSVHSQSSLSGSEASAAVSSASPKMVVGSETETPQIIQKALLLLQNGLVLGVVCAIALHYLLPELGLRWYGLKKYSLLAAVVAAGHFGVLHWFYYKGRTFFDRAVTKSSSAQKAMPVSNTVANNPDPAVLTSDKKSAVLNQTVPQRATIENLANKRDMKSSRKMTAKEPAQQSLPLAFRFPKCLGIFIGITVAAVTSTLKPTLGLNGLAWTLAGGASIFVLVFVVLSLLMVVMGDRDAERRRSFASRRAWMTRMCCTVLVIFGGLVWGEYFTGEEGLVRSVFTKVSRESQAEKVARKDAVWTQASFLLVNPEHLAIAVKVDTSRTPAFYQLLAKSADADAIEAQKLAWNLKIPIIANDPAIARRVYTETEADGWLSTEASRDLRELWKPKDFLPSKAILVSFEDTRGRQRIGHALGTAEAIAAKGEFQFVELLPIVKDQLKTQTDTTAAPRRISSYGLEDVPLRQTGSDIRPFDVLSDRDLRDFTDFLDYCLYNVVVKLQSHQSRPVYLFTDDVQADVQEGDFGLMALKSERKLIGDKADADYRDTVHAEGGVTNFREFFFRRIADVEAEQKKSNIRRERRQQLEQELSELKSDVAKLAVIADQNKRLTSEIRSKLVRAGIPLVERSDRARDIFRKKIRGNAWLRPSSADELDTAVSSQLVTASHILLTEIRSAEFGGRYQLSMRVVDVDTGLILWEDQGDRVAKSSSSASN